MNNCVFDLSATVQCIFALIPIVGIILAFRNRISKDNQTKRGLGKRFIQLTGTFIVVPAIFILAMQGIIEKQLLGGLLGAIIGYLLSDLASKDTDEKTTS